MTTQESHKPIEGKEIVAAIGTFDGVHRGHRSVLRALVDYAVEHDMQPVAFTFNRHPLALIDATRTPVELTPLPKKKKLLEEVGAIPMVIDFNESIRATSAEGWLRRLHDEFGVRVLVLGYDNTFGSDGVNLTLEDYRKLGDKVGVKVLTAEEIKGVSSSAIRKAVMEGDVELAQEMLGRPYSITARVVKGNGLGHDLGYPTANIDVPEGAALPKPGVYAAIVKILKNGSKHLAMVNIGQRPTVMRGDYTVIEAHLLDWTGDLYGKEITVRFIKRLRDERKFDSIDALREQLGKDKMEVVKLLGR